MRKSRNINYNAAGKGSCLLLVLLAFLVVNPVGGFAYAEGSAPEDVPADELSDEGELGSGVVNYDNQIALATDASTINIAFAPSSGSASLTPTTSAGQSAQINVLATVSVQNSSGYSVYVKSDTQNLVGEKTGGLIPGVSGTATYDNLVTNTWGYYAGEGTAVPEDATYKAMSVTGNGDKVAENTSNKIYSDTKQVILSFAARVGDDKPADTYQNTVTMSVVSAPWVVAADFGIADMQEMTSTVCANAKDNDGDGVISGQLEDTRDGKYYWVSKLADGKCWMTQNLDLDLSTSVALTPLTSDVSSNWTPGFTTATVANGSTINTSNTGQNSWSLGDYRIANPNTSSDCGYPKNDVLQCTAQFMPYDTPITANGETDAHYILGNHYQWNAATAGTGGSITGGQASGSICPKGWRLPTSNTNGEFGKLVTALGGASSTNNVTQAPFYGVRAGRVYQDITNLFAYAGDNGRYWSSTPTSTSNAAYSLSFASTNNVNPSFDSTRRYGLSVRCVAR